MTKEREYTFEMLAPMPSKKVTVRAYSLDSAYRDAEAYYKGELRSAANNCCAHLITDRDLPEE